MPDNAEHSPTGAPSEGEPADSPDVGTDAPPPPPAPLLELRDGLPDVVDTDEGLAEACTALAAATGPVAIDAERASGYRYSNRAYLIQLRREGAGTWLVDPIPMSTLAPLQRSEEHTSELQSQFHLVCRLLLE